MSKETVNKIIKSCIVSRKGGVPLNEIENDYKELVGQTIPYASLGYKNLREFITSIDYIKVNTNFLGDVILCVSDPKIAHIDSLVSKQKNPSNRFTNSKKSRQNRYNKNRGSNNEVPRENRSCSNQHVDQNNRQVAKFSRNKKMAYSQSKWYSDRPKDSWRKTKNENRKSSRYNNFNAGRPSIQNNNNNYSPVRNDNSWSAKSASPSSTEENLYNFQSEEERRYAEESRGWRFEVQIADDGNSNSTVRNSQYGPYNPQPWNSSVSRPPCGEPINNFNYWWREWYPYSYPCSWAPYDNQGGEWWPGHQGYANVQYQWMHQGFQYPQTYPTYYPWNNYNQNAS